MMKPQLKSRPLVRQQLLTLLNTHLKFGVVSWIGKWMIAFSVELICLCTILYICGIQADYFILELLDVVYQSLSVIYRMFSPGNDSRTNNLIVFTEQDIILDACLSLKRAINYELCDINE